MKAPEKIYLSAIDLDDVGDLLSKSNDRDDIEYVRADVFIDKALAYLNDKFCFNNEFYGVVSTDFNSMEEMYKDFKNYMKGE